MVNDIERIGIFRQEFYPGFVIGLILDGHAKAYCYTDVAEIDVLNDDFGGFPVMLWAADNNFHAYLLRVGDRVLTFEVDGEK